MSDYRIVILQDRYSGVYSGGEWLSVADATEMHHAAQTRLEFCLSASNGPSGPDPDAASFWVNPPSWISVGRSPDEALLKLRNSFT
jgi:hypothetical protein